MTRLRKGKDHRVELDDTYAKPVNKRKANSNASGRSGQRRTPSGDSTPIKRRPARIRATQAKNRVLHSLADFPEIFNVGGETITPDGIVISWDGWKRPRPKRKAKARAKKRKPRNTVTILDASMSDEELQAGLDALYGE